MVCQTGMPRAFSKLLGRGRSRFLFWGGMRHENAGGTVEEAPKDVACIGGEQICEWSRATAQEKVAALLANYSDDIDAVISCNDDMALGANSFYVDRPGPGQHQGGLCVDSAAHLRRGAGDGALLPAG